MHFTLRGMKSISMYNKKRRGPKRLGLWEHPEDLGRTRNGEPASVWQLPETRAIATDEDFITVAGHQCQYAGVDRKKPTRLLGNIPGLRAFGRTGLPCFDTSGWYKGPLPHSCGHNHSQKMIGRTAEGGFHTSPTAAYPEAMCQWIANIVFNSWTGKTLTAGISKSGHTCPNNSLAANSGGSIKFHNNLENQDERSTELCETQGIDRPLAEGPCLPDPRRRDWAAADTSDEEVELQNRPRPKKGAGWWGAGQPIHIHHKGEPRPLTDGAGLPSPDDFIVVGLVR